MTRALLTKRFKDALSIGGFIVVVDAGGTTASMYREHLRLDGKLDPAQYVGKLSYSDQSVDYNILMGLVRSAA